MTKKKIIYAVDAYIYSYEHGNLYGHCERILSELEAENFHGIIKMLLAKNFEAARAEARK